MFNPLYDPSAYLDPLDAMALKAEALYPGIMYHGGEGSRAQAAADFIRAGDVEFIEDLPVTGYDHWLVHGHHCSFRQQVCDCRDEYAPVDPKLGRLCKHCLAVMFVLKRQAMDRRVLATIIDLAAGADLWLEVRVYYAHTGDVYNQRNVLTRYRIEGRRWTEPLGEIEFTTRDLVQILADAGYRIRPGAKVRLGRHVGGKERWLLEHVGQGQGNARAATAIDALYGADAATAEERGREHRLRDMADAALPVSGRGPAAVEDEDGLLWAA